MNKLKLFKVIDLIDEDLVKEAEINTEHKPSSETESERNITVSGIEIYQERKWQRAALIAAAFLLVAGLGAGGMLMFRNRPPMLDEPALPSDISAVDETSPFERVTDSESSITDTKKNEQTAKGSSDINTAAAAEKDENKPAVTTDLDPMYAEINRIHQNSNTETTQAPKTDTDDFADHAKDFPIVTTPDGAELPISTKPDNVDDFLNHANDFPVVTSPDGSPKPIATKPIVDDPDGFANFDIFESLSSLSYSPDTCDGIPEYVLLAPDGTWYYINLSSGWIWRKTPDHQWTQPPEEAWLTKTQLSYLRQHGEEIGMRLDILD